MALSGVWLPIVTPFLDGKVDFRSYERLLEHYVGTGLAGIIPLGTTGESATLEGDEIDAIVDLTTRVIGNRLPIYVGVGGNSTSQVIATLERLDAYPFDGILSVCPYYNRPSEEGIRRHFEHITAGTRKNIILYNIPYRTGVNLSNDSVIALSRFANIVGVKDSCAHLAQSQDLVRRRPPGFAVLTGEDAQFFTTLALGGDGGILASAHFSPQTFVEVYRRMAANDHQGARRTWATLEPAVQLMFREPNPMPLKHWLWRQGLIESPECRLPMTRVSTELAEAIEQLQVPAEESVQ